MVRSDRNARTDLQDEDRPVPGHDEDRLQAGVALGFRDLLRRALDRRRALLDDPALEAIRVFHGAADGLEGVLVDRYGRGAVLALREPPPLESAEASRAILEGAGVSAVYYKPFVENRPHLAGALGKRLLDPRPLSGAPLPEAYLVRERAARFEVRLYAGFSTGLFLDQRENRAFLASGADGLRLLNAFCYTCSFSVAASLEGATTTNVDVSSRALAWARRNFDHNGLDAADHRFVKMDALRFLAHARKRGLRYDLIVLDPPTFSSGDRRRGIRPWSAVRDYARLVGEAAAVLAPGGRIFASTNASGLCAPGRLEREIERGLGARPRWHPLPPRPPDFPGGEALPAYRLFTLPTRSRPAAPAAEGRAARAPDRPEGARSSRGASRSR
ncbi:MAG: class I SAM-dependent rRNA methyltransferase [Planctomycetota bacterium]